MFALAWSVERSRLGSLRFLRFVVRKLVRDLFLEFSTWQIALVSLAAGVSEEMFFRGILFDAICEKLDISLVVWGLMLASSLLFSFLYLSFDSCLFHNNNLLHHCENVIKCPVDNQPTWEWS